MVVIFFLRIITPKQRFQRRSFFKIKFMSKNNCNHIAIKLILIKWDDLLINRENMIINFSYSENGINSKHLKMYSSC